MSGRDHHEASQDDSVLVVYVEPLLRDRRVLFIGDADSDALRRVARAASRIVAFDTSEGARPARLPNGVVEPYDPFELEALAVDVVVVPNVLALGTTLEDRLDDFARMLGRRGHLVAGLPVVHRGLDHEELWDLLAVRFDAVRLAGTARIEAVAVAELGPESVANVVVDGSLVREPAPTLGFVAVAGQTDPEIEGYVIVQLDTNLEREAAIAPARSDARTRELEDEVVALAEALAAARAQAGQIKAERDASRDERKRFERELREARDVESKLRGRLGDLEEHLRSAPSAEELAKLEERTSTQVARLRELELEVERRGRLVRELVEETHDRGHAGGADPAELERAVERAVRAEAERAAALFTVDELRARLADHTDAGVEAMREREADLSGRVRGMRARVAELEARVAEGEAAVSHARAAVRAELAESSAASEREQSGRIGQLLGQLVRARESEAEAKEARDLARGENLALVAQVGALETQMRDLRERSHARVDRILRAKEPSPSLESALERLEAAVESLRGERAGLALRVQSLELGTSSSTPASQGSSPDAGSSVEVANLLLENKALAADLADAKDEVRRATEGAMATRDALVERLQLELAENERRALAAEERERAHSAEIARLRVAVVEASSGVEERDALALRVRKLEDDLRDAIVAAERAADDARRQGSRADELLSRAGAAETDAAETRAALAETRAILDELRTASEAARTSVGGYRSELAADIAGAEDRVRDDGSEKDLLLRSLTAQLEERDDRIRALERRIGDAGSLPAGDVEALQRSLMDLQERATRLSDELRVEREARRVAEERAASSFGTAVGAAQRELERRTENQERELEEARLRLESFERDVRALRDVFVETRSGLEHLLGASSGSGDPALVERIGELLTLLGRY